MAAYGGGPTVHTEKLPWLPLASGVGVRVLELDRETGAFSVMIRAEPGGILPRHKHIESAKIYVIKGQGTHPQTGPYRAGDYISEPRDALHDAVAFTEATELLMVCNGPSVFLADDDSVQHVMDVGMLEHLSAAHACSND
jgi:quercetin dioxygenase-like cupin family protein